MAMIERRGPGQWRVRIRKKGFPVTTRTFDKRTKAERWAKKIETEMDDMTFISRKEAERTSLKQLLERYRDEITPEKKGKLTETKKIEFLLRHPICRRKLSTLAPADFSAFRDERLKEVSAGTVNKDLSLFSHAFTIAIKEWGIHLPNNPLMLIRRPRNARARDRRFEGDEEERLFEAMHETLNPWIKPLIQIAIETAMRRGELLNLEWKYVDLKTRVAHLPDTKNGDPRNVPLSTKAVNVLNDLPRNINGRVFPLTVESVHQAFRRLIKRAEIKNFRFHDLRHEATSRLFEKGLNIMEVSAITGHKDLKMLKRYTHLKAEDLARKIM